MSDKLRADPERAKAMQERARERNLILQEMKNRGGLTIDALHESTGIPKPRIVKHLIALQQFGKVLLVGQRGNQFEYALV